MKRLRPIGVEGLTLFATRCAACAHVTAHGFWQQLDKEVDAAAKRATVRVACRRCGHPARLAFRLTSGRPGRRRLCPWLRWWAALVSRRWFPTRLSHRPAAWRAVEWLERRLPL